VSAEKKTLIIPLLLITLGVGSLLTSLGIVPGVDRVWTLGLAVVGVLSFVLSGVDKVSIVIGPFFIIASCLSLLRQTDRLSVDTEVPILVIAAGVLLLVARHPAFAVPEWLAHQHGKRK
jgi:hypothetical protein